MWEEENTKGTYKSVWKEVWGVLKGVPKTEENGRGTRSPWHVQ